MKLKLLKFINVILASLLAGTSFGIWFGFNPKMLTQACYLQQQQNMVHSLNTLMIVLVIAATLTTLFSAYVQRNNRITFVSLLIAASCFIACIVITRIGNVPIQTEMLAWSESSMPVDWTSMRDTWWTYHIQRTIAELLALALVCWTSIGDKSISRN